jgi:hypothetical protein
MEPVQVRDRRQRLATGGARDLFYSGVVDGRSIAEFRTVDSAGRQGRWQSAKKRPRLGLAGGFGAVLFSVSFSQQQYIFIQTHSIRG